MNKVTAVNVIVKLYFLGAIAGSFTHIITAAEKVGLSGWEMYSTPFMIDGLAIIGMVMRSHEFSTKTRKIGFRVQCTMGALSLVANVYAAHNIGGIIYGVGIVALFVAAEWLADNIEGAGADVVVEAEKAIDAAAARKAEITAKRLATRKRNQVKAAKAAKAETKALESALAAS